MMEAGRPRPAGRAGRPFSIIQKRMGYARAYSHSINMQSPYE
jgi:hypothetical protein